MGGWVKNKEELKVTKEEIKQVKGIKNTLKALKLAKINKKYLFLVTFFFVVQMVANIFDALLVKEFLTFFTTKQYDKFIPYAFIFLGIHLIIYVCDYLQSYFFDKLTNQMNLNLKAATYEKISNLKAHCFTSNQTSTFTSRVSDASSITADLQMIYKTVYTLIVSLSYSIIIFINAPLLALIAIAFYMVRFISTNFIMPKGSVLRKSNRKVADEAQNILLESVRGAQDVKSLNFSENLKQSFYEKTKENYDKDIKISLWSRKRFAIVNFISHPINNFVMIFLFYWFLTHDFYNAGGILFFWSYKANLRNVFDSLYMLKKRFADTEISASRLLELWDEEKYPAEKFGTRVFKNFKGNIRFKNVHFEYEKGKPILNGVNFEIEPNKITAIVGKTGCGKSTTLSLIARFYDVKKGHITIDGINVKSLSKDALRGNIAYVQQSPYIFNRSFKENLLLVKPDATDEEIEDVCKKSEIHDFIIETKDKYDTLIGENGITLSGGQRQRLAIARALLSDAKIIMFDESTSSLDNENQAKIQKTIENLSKTHTIIIVAHRLSTIINADKIIFMKDQNVKAEGTHSELFETCEDYKELYQIENKKD